MIKKRQLHNKWTDLEEAEWKSSAALLKFSDLSLSSSRWSPLTKSLLTLSFMMLVTSSTCCLTLMHNDKHYIILSIHTSIWESKVAFYLIPLQLAVWICSSIISENDTMNNREKKIKLLFTHESNLYLLEDKLFIASVVGGILEQLFLKILE